MEGLLGRQREEERKVVQEDDTLSPGKSGVWQRVKPRVEGRPEVEVRTVD